MMYNLVIKGGKSYEKRDMEDSDTDDDICIDSHSHYARHYELHVGLDGKG